MNASEQITYDVLGDNAKVLIWVWNHDEYVDDALQRAEVFGENFPR